MDESPLEKRKPPAAGATKGNGLSVKKESIAMKRILSVILCLLALAACAPALAEGAKIEANWLPGEVKEFFSDSAYFGCAIGENGACLVDNTPGGTYLFAVTQKQGHNVLYGFEQKNGRFNYWLRTDSALPQGEGFFNLRKISGSLQMLNDDALNMDNTLSILFTRADYEEQGDTSLYFTVNQYGQFKLRLLCYDSLWREARFTDDSIAYYSEGEYLGTAYGTVERNLRYFSLGAFPRTLKEARQKLTQAPAIPSGELTAQKIKFTGGQKFPVYSGPGAEYERAANGKASVSTNDWIQVFGSEKGYIMIQYAISASQMRIGYIDSKALPKNAAVSELQLARADAEITASTFLTDDPLNSQTRTRALSAGQKVKWLSTMGSWVYVEVSGSGQPIRGFVPGSAVSREQPSVTYAGSFRNSVYSAQASVSVLRGVAAEISVTVDGPDAWKEAGADKITGYQVYANNVPLAALSQANLDLTTSSWRTVFTLSASVPNGATLLGLCPVHAQSGQQADEMIVIRIGSSAK